MFARIVKARKGVSSKLLYLAVLIVFGSLCLVISASAQSACKLTVRNRSGSSIGRIDSNGTIRDASGSTIGRFDSGTVRGASGSSIGRVDSNGTIRNRSGSTIGRVDSKGILRNSSGASVGKIDSNGTVRNKSGASKGRFDGYVPACRHLAAAYLFFFEPLYNH